MVDFDLLIKYFAGQAGPDEAIQIEEWLEADPANHAYFDQLYQSWLDAGSDIYNLPDAEQEWQRFLKRNNRNTATPQRTGMSWITRIAASVAIIGTAIAGYYIFNSNNRNGEQQIFAASARPDTIKLADGTHVGLQTGAELVYPIRFKENVREVTLVGSGSFKVAHEPGRPFIVHVGTAHVKVLGTSFEISRNNKWINVAVKEGKVAFYNKADTLYISAGFSGKYSIVAKRFELNRITPLTGSFNFEDIPLSEAAKQIGACFNVKIYFDNPAIENCRVSAVFDQKTLPYILTAITETFNLTVQIDSTNIHISGKECL